MEVAMIGKGIKVWAVIASLAVGELATGQDRVGSDRPERDVELIGAKVVGPSSLGIGTVTGLLREEDSGAVAMYVVGTGGIFGGTGVIPVSNEVERRTLLDKDGNTQHRIEVRVNRSTFRNLAKWNGKGNVASYLSEHSGLLSLVYGLDAERLERKAITYTLDTGPSESEAVVVSQ